MNGDFWGELGFRVICFALGAAAVAVLAAVVVKFWQWVL